MKAKKIISVLVLLTSITALAGCNNGANANNQISSTSTLQIETSKDVITFVTSKENNSNSSTSSSAQSSSEIETSSIESNTTSTSETSAVYAEEQLETKKILEIVNKAYKAIQEENLNDLLQYTNVNNYYIKTHKIPETVAQQQKEIQECYINGNTEDVILPHWNEYKNNGIEFEPQEIFLYSQRKSDGTLDTEIEQRIISMFNNNSNNYFADRVVFVRFINPDKAPQTEDTNGLGVMVFHINGKWKMDIYPTYSSPNVITKKVVTDYEKTFAEAHDNYTILDISEQTTTQE